MSAAAMEPRSTLDTVLAYARRGWLVFPVHAPGVDGACDCDKECGSPAKHPRTAHGLSDASTDFGNIAGWWRRWPDANVGIRTGSVSGLVVIDVDSYKGGDDGLAALVEDYGPMPATLAADTGGGGHHLLYRFPEGMEVRNRAGLATGVDVRADGGYIVAPPSRHISGGLYRWQRPLLEVAELPGWLSEPKREKRVATGPMPKVPDAAENPYVRSALNGEMEELRKAMPGTRNHQLNRAAFNLGQFVPHAMSESEVRGLVTSAGIAIGLGEAEVAATVTSGVTAGMAEPRRIPERPRLVASNGERVVANEEQPGAPDDEAQRRRQEVLKPALEFVSARRLVELTDNVPDVGWLAEPVWPADAYGVIAAEQKLGKTWAVLDLVVSVAAGTAWMDAFPTPQGNVLVFLGEGGQRKMRRRLDAVCESQRVPCLADLPIELCFRVPHLTSDVHLALLAAKLDEFPARLVVIDPLYLAARGAKGSQLYEMGEHLETVQRVVQDHGGALVIVHHWNKTGEGKGAKRMSGVGPGEWGRVLVSMSLLSKSIEENKASNVLAHWQFEGDEISDYELHTRRRIWSDDPTNLSAPLHYELSIVAEPDNPTGTDLDQFRPAARRVLAALQLHGGWMSTSSLGDALAEVGHPLKARTIQAALQELRIARYAVGPGGPSGFGWKVWEDDEEEGESL